MSPANSLPYPLEQPSEINNHNYITATTNTTTPMDVEMEEAPVDMGYEDHEPAQRRGSMSHDEEKQRRASIKAIMADTTISPMAKRRSIQHLMDGRRNSLTGGSAHTMEGRRNSIAGGTGEGRRNSLTGGSGHSINGYGSLHSSIPSVCSNGSGENPDFANDASGTGFTGTHDEFLHHQQNTQQLNVNNAEDYTISNEFTMRAERTRPICSHYERKCTLIAPCCGAAFGCRICHDDCPVLPPKINNSDRHQRSASLPSSFTSMDPEDTHHNIDRFAVTEVICRECFTRQSSKTNNCRSCGIQFGSYHCKVCNLWMSDEEAPYHCNDCGFCRVGGAENFRHCDACGMCIDQTLYESHNCKAGKYRSNCPVCQEYLFSSRSASHEMPCGHAIHWDCFRQLAAHDSRCPVCKKTAETRERMMPTWNAMASGVALQPVPPELARVVSITCNDCEKSADARAWHFLGVQCDECSSFNTVVDKIVLTGEEAHEFLTRNAMIAQQSQENRPRRRVNRRRSAH